MSEAVPRPARRVANNNNNPSTGPAKRLSPHDRALALRKEQQLRTALDSRSHSHSTEYEYIVVEEEEEDEEEDRAQLPTRAARPVARGAVVTQLETSSSTSTSDTSYLYEEEEESDYTPSEEPNFLQMIGASPPSQSLEPPKQPLKVKRTMSPHLRTRVRRGQGADSTWSNADAQGNVSMESFQRSGSNLTGWTGAHFLTPRNSGEKNGLDQFDRLQRADGAGKNGATSPGGRDAVRVHTPQRKLAAGTRRPSSDLTKPTATLPLTDDLLNPLRHGTNKLEQGATGTGPRRAPQKAAVAPQAQPSSSPTPAVNVPQKATAVDGGRDPPRKATATVSANTAVGNGAKAPAATNGATGGTSKPPNRALMRTSPGLSPEAQSKVPTGAGAPPAGATSQGAGIRPQPSEAPTKGGTAAATATKSSSSPRPNPGSAPASAAKRASVVPTTTTTAGVANGNHDPSSSPRAPPPTKVAVKNPKPVAATRTTTTAAPPPPPTSTATLARQATTSSAADSGPSAATGGVGSPKADEPLHALKKLPMAPLQPSATTPVARARRNSVLPAAAPRHSPSGPSSVPLRPIAGAGASNATLPPGAGDHVLSDPSSSTSANTPTKAAVTQANNLLGASVGHALSDSPASAGETLAGTSSRGTCGDAGLALRRKRSASNRPAQVRMTSIDMITPSTRDDNLAVVMSATPTMATPTAPTRALGTAVVSTHAKVPNKPLLQSPRHDNDVTTAGPTTDRANAPAVTTRPSTQTTVPPKQKVEEAVQKKRDELLARMKSSEPPAGKGPSAAAAAAVPTPAGTKIDKKPMTLAAAQTVNNTTAASPAPPPRKAEPNPAKPAAAPAVRKKPLTVVATPITRQLTHENAAPSLPPALRRPSAAPVAATETAPAANSTNASPVLRTLTRPSASPPHDGTPATTSLRQTQQSGAVAESTDSAGTGPGSKTLRRTDSLEHRGGGPLPLPMPPTGQRAVGGTAGAAPVRTAQVPALAAVTTPAAAPAGSPAPEEGQLSPAKRGHRRTGSSPGARRGGATGGRASLLTSQIFLDMPDSTNDSANSRRRQSGADANDSDQPGSGSRDGASGRPHRYKRGKRKQQQLRMTEIPSVPATRLSSSAKKGSAPDAAVAAAPTAVAAAPERDYQRATSGAANIIPAALQGATLHPADASARTGAAGSSNNNNSSTPPPLGTTPAPLVNSGGTASGRQPFSARFTPAEQVQSAPCRQAILLFNRGIEEQIKAMSERQLSEEREQEMAVVRRTTLPTMSGAGQGGGKNRGTGDTAATGARPRPQSTLPHTKPASRYTASQSVRDADVASLPPRLAALSGGGVDRDGPGTIDAPMHVGDGQSPRPSVRHPTGATARTRPKATSAPGSVGRATSYSEDRRPRSSLTDQADSGTANAASPHGHTGRASLPSSQPTQPMPMANADRYGHTTQPTDGDVPRQSSTVPRTSLRTPLATSAEGGTTSPSSVESTGLPPVQRRSTTRPLTHVRMSDHSSHTGSGVGLSGNDPHRHRRRVSLAKDGSEVMLMEDVSDGDEATPELPTPPRQRTLSSGRRRSRVA